MYITSWYSTDIWNQFLVILYYKLIQQRNLKYFKTIVNEAMLLQTKLAKTTLLEINFWIVYVTRW